MEWIPVRIENGLLKVVPVGTGPVNRMDIVPITDIVEQVAIAVRGKDKFIVRKYAVAS